VVILLRPSDGGNSLASRQCRSGREASRPTGRVDPGECFATAHPLPRVGPPGRRGGPLCGYASPVNGRGLTGAATRFAAVAFAVLAVAGCGEEEATPKAADPSSSASPTAGHSASSGAPDCAVIWNGGGELPRSYGGCNSNEGFVASDKLGCSSGQRLVRYGDHFYAVPGGTIHETESPLEDDRGYRVAVASCRA
jgi:hypothetical protein